MEFDVRWVDLTENLTSGDQPVVYIKREAARGKQWAGGSVPACVAEHWVPLQSVLDPAVPTAELFALTREGDAVRVPVLAYRTVNRTEAGLFGLGLQIGLATVARLVEHTQVTPRRVVLVLGHQCTDLSPGVDAFRCYVGIAVQTK